MKKRVLIADDEASIRESLGKLLKENGYEVILATNGEEAETSLVSQQIDLLILDLQMPGRDGWDVFESVSSRDSLVPVIMITGLADQLDTRTMPGLDALIEKPLDAGALLKKVEELCTQTPEQRLERLSRGRGAGPGYLALPLGGHWTNNRSGC